MARSYIKKATRLNNGVTLGTAILPFGRYAAMQRYEKISNLQTNFKQNARKYSENNKKHPPRHSYIKKRTANILLAPAGEESVVISYGILVAKINKIF
jgi:hypothetical protein